MNDRQILNHYLETFYDEWSARTGDKIKYDKALYPLCEAYQKPEKFYSTFLTLNFEPNASTREIHNKIKLIVLRKHYLKDKDIVYNFENTDHVHCHMLIKGETTQPSKLIRDMSRIFKINKNYVDCKNSTNEDLYQTRLNYIKGIKKTSKTEAVEKDKVWRSKQCLEEYYQI